MIRVLLCIDHPTRLAVVKTAFKQFPDLAAYPVPHSKAVELLNTCDYHAVVVDLFEDYDNAKRLAEDVKAACKNVAVVALIDGKKKEHSNRLKFSLGLFSCVSIPLDAFDLAQRIVRLERHINSKHSTLA